MSIHRIWIEIVVLATTVACALALLLATLGAIAGTSLDAEGQEQKVAVPQTQKAELQQYEGMLSCAKCDGRHSPNIGKSAAECTRACAHAGEPFALVSGDTIYALNGGLECLKHAAGERVSIVGSMEGNVIHVVTIKSHSNVCHA